MARNELIREVSCLRANVEGKLSRRFVKFFVVSGGEGVDEKIEEVDSLPGYEQWRIWADPKLWRWKIGILQKVRAQNREELRCLKNEKLLKRLRRTLCGVMRSRDMESKISGT